MTLEFRPFNADDFPVYQSWFQEETTRTHLGGVDADWFAHVLSHPDQPEYAIYAAGEMVAEIGLVLATPKDPHHVISNVCVAPQWRGRGIALKVLKELLESGVLPEDGLPVRAYVAPDNPGAQACFRRAGWREYAPDEEMIPFEQTREAT